MRLRTLSAVAVGIFAATLSFSEPAQEPSATDFAQALQRKYDTTRDFSADFVQTYRGGVLNRQMKATGRLLVKKPGKMRWEYKTPEERLFVSDGVKGYAYTPQDRQVIVTAVPPEDQASTPELFLAGKGNISADFTVAFTEAPAG